MKEGERRFDRVPEAFQVTCRPAGALAETWRQVATLDLSAGGISFEIEAIYDLEDRLEVRITLPGASAPVDLRGRVVRFRPLPSGVSACSIEFIEVTPDQQAHIDELVQFLRKPPQPSA